MILNHKTVPKEQLPRGIFVRCPPKSCMTSELTKYWLLVVWNRRPGVLLRKQEMLVLNAFKRLLTPEIKAAGTICSMSIDLMVILRGITSELQVLDVVNKPFKNHLKQQYSEWLWIEDLALAPSGRIKKPIVIPLSQ